MTDGVSAEGCPRDPEVDDTWVDEGGELYTWNGTEWVAFADIPDFASEVELPFTFRSDER